MENRFVITGATGFLGSALVAKLLQEGISPAKILLLVRKTPSSRESVLALRLREANMLQCWEALRFQETAFHSSGEFQKTLESLDLKESRIIHLAAIIHPAPGEEKLQQRINVGVTQELLEWGTRKGAQQFIFLSSVVAFGGIRNAKLRKETDFQQGLSEESQQFNYYVTKRQAHENVLRSAKIPLSILCPGIVHGSLEHFKSSRSHLKALQKGRLSWAPSGGANIVSLQKVVQGVYEELQRTPQAQEQRTRLLVDANLSYQRYFQIYADACSKIFSVPSVHVKKVPEGICRMAMKIWIFARISGLSKIRALRVFEGLAQASLYLFFESEFPVQTSTQGIESAIESSLLSHRSNG